MSFIASIVLSDRIVQISDSRVVSGWNKEMQIESDSAKKLFALPNGYALGWAGVHFDPATGRTLEEALERFTCPVLPPAAFADALREHLVAFWEGASEPQFCFHLVGYHQGRPFLLVRFNPPPPPELAGELNAPVQPFALQVNGADDDVLPVLEGMRFPPFHKMLPPHVVNFLVDLTFRVIDQVPCCGGDVQVQIITPERASGFKATRRPLVWRAAYAPGKYGVKVTQGEVFSTLVRSAAPESTGPYVELAPDGYFNVIGPTGKKTLDIYAGADQGTVRWLEDNASGQRVQFATIALNGAITRDLWVATWEGNGIFLSADVGGSISIGPTGGVNRQGINIGGYLDDCDLSPYDTGTGNVGTGTNKWFQVRALYITPGDVCFEETACPVCGQPFAPGDALVLLVHTIHEDLGTMTVPIHEKCRGVPAEITVKVPEVEIRYRLNEKGEVVPYKAAKTVEFEEEIRRVKKGFRFDERTGGFTKEASGENRLRPDAATQENPGGLEEDFTEGTVEPERPATKEEALEAVVVKRRRPVYRTVTVSVGK